MLPLLSCCLRLEGIHYIPGYRQLAKAIFQLCAFKELIGGEIILSRWRHNFSHLPWGLPVLKGGARQPGVSPGPHPGTGLHMGRCSPGEAHAGLGVPPAAHGGVPPLLRTGPGVALAVPLSRFLCTPFPSPPPRIPAAPALPRSCTKPGAADLRGAVPRAKFIRTSANPQPVLR